MSLLLVAVLLLTAALLVYGLFAWEHIVTRRQDGEAAAASARAGSPATVPDTSRAFGRDAVWLAVRSSDAEAVRDGLGLRTVLPANWRDGLAAMRTAGVFVTPVVDGCVLVVGHDLARIEVETAVLPLLQRLAAVHGAAAWFLSDSEHDRHGWALAHAGELQRAFLQDGEHGVLLAHGEPTAAEHELGCFVDDPRDRSDDELKWWPDRAIVHGLAARWSVDPDRFARRGAERSVGWVGRLPR